MELYRFSMRNIPHYFYFSVRMVGNLYTNHGYYSSANILPYYINCYSRGILDSRFCFFLYFFVSNMGLYHSCYCFSMVGY